MTLFTVPSPAYGLLRLADAEDSILSLIGRSTGRTLPDQD